MRWASVLYSRVNLLFRSDSFWYYRYENFHRFFAPITMIVSPAIRCRTITFNNKLESKIFISAIPHRVRLGLGIEETGNRETRNDNVEQRTNWFVFWLNVNWTKRTNERAKIKRKMPPRIKNGCAALILIFYVVSVPCSLSFVSVFRIFQVLKEEYT